MKHVQGAMMSFCAEFVLGEKEKNNLSETRWKTSNSLEVTNRILDEALLGQRV